MRNTAFFVLCLMVAFPMTAQVSAWGEADGQLWIVHLPGGEMEAVGPTGIDRLQALAWTPDETLLGLVDADAGGELYEISAATGAATLVVAFDQLGVYGLTVLADGRIFVSAGSDLNTAGSEVYEVDPADGSTRFVGDLGEPIWALVDDGAELIAYAGAFTAPSRIFTIDPESGNAMLLNSSPELPRSPRAAMVAPSGSAWTLESAYLQDFGYYFTAQEIEDYGQSTMTTYDSYFYDIFTPESKLNSLAWRGGQGAGAVAIPTLGTVGQASLALLLALAGWCCLVRR